jgi:hypothetical protein
VHPEFAEAERFSKHQHTMSNLANQPAFPRRGGIHNQGGNYGHQQGMTIRQYFASLAMQGLVSDSETITGSIHEATAKNGDERGLDIIATLAVGMADALITKLEKP